MQPKSKKIKIKKISKRENLNIIYVIVNKKLSSFQSPARIDGATLRSLSVLIKSLISSTQLNIFMHTKQSACITKLKLSISCAAEFVEHMSPLSNAPRLSIFQYIINQSCSQNKLFVSC